MLQGKLTYCYLSPGNNRRGPFRRRTELLHLPGETEPGLKAPSSDNNHIGIVWQN